MIPLSSTSNVAVAAAAASLACSILLVPDVAAMGSSSCSGSYTHFSTGWRASCPSGYCTTFAVDGKYTVKPSLVKKMSTVDDYGAYFANEIGAGGYVDTSHCDPSTPNATNALTSSGVDFTPAGPSCAVYELESNSVPDHDVEDYCSAAGSNLPPYIGTLDNYTYDYTFPKAPSNDYVMETNNVVGVAVNGVAIFSPFTGKGTVAAEDETLDTCNGHPSDKDGLYHYHGFSPCVHNETIVRGKSAIPAHSPIYGWAFDGFPIYGPYGYKNPNNAASDVVRMRTSYSVTSSGDDGTCPQHWEYGDGTGHLDECNGRYTVTPEFPDGMYVYYMNVDSSGNPEFPAVPYCFQSSSFTDLIEGNMVC